MVTRFWDLAYPERSYIVAGGANDSLHCPSVLYSRKIIEGTEVVQVHTHTHTRERLLLQLFFTCLSSLYFPSCLFLCVCEVTVSCPRRKFTVNRRAAWWRTRLAAAQNPSLWDTMTSSLTSPPSRRRRASSSPRPETALSRCGSEDGQRAHTYTHTGRGPTRLLLCCFRVMISN